MAVVHRKKLMTGWVAGAAAAAVVVGASPAGAAVFAQFTPDKAAPDLKWVRSASQTGGHLFSISSSSATTAQGVATHFSFLDPGMTALAFVPATFTLDATIATGTPATVNSAGIYSETNLNGHFSFIYRDPTKPLNSFQTIGGFTLQNGVTNLLSGVFTDAWIQGAGGTGSVNLTPTNTAVVTYTSNIDHFTNMLPHTGEFAFNILGAKPGMSAPPGRAFSNFTANGGGNFAASYAPEPVIWGLLIVGFGAVGARLRSGRRPMGARS